MYGHTHRQVVDSGIEPWVLNPGACGRTRLYDGGSGCLVLEAGEARWRVQQWLFRPGSARHPGACEARWVAG